MNNISSIPETFAHSVLDALSAHIAILDVNGKIIYVNKAWQEFAQQNSSCLDALLSEINYFQSYHSTDSATPYEAKEARVFTSGICDVIAGHKSEFTLESVCHSPTEKRWFLGKVTKFQIKEDIFVVVSYENITERKLVEQALLEKESRLGCLVESNVIGIIFWHLDGQITKANSAFFAMTGYSQQDIDTKQLRWDEITPKEHQVADQQAIDQLNKYGYCNSFEKEYFRKDGSKVPILLAGTFFPNSKNEGVSYILDLTKQKQLQNQLLQAQKMENLGILASGIAHDLNNILTPILIFVDLLKKKLSDPKDHEIVGSIENTIKRGADLVRQILCLARTTENVFVKINFRKLLSDIELLIKETFPKSVVIDVNVEKNLIPIVGNTTELYQVILNLCVNARDAMPNGGYLNITVKNTFVDESYKLINVDAQVGQYVLISISDTGSGISSDNLEKIFTPFFTTKGNDKGTGLGLPIVLSIIKKHGGFITINTELLEGSEFNIYLPIHEAIVFNQVNTVKDVFPMGQGETILVVDDEIAVCNITGLILESYGYKILTAIDGADAIATYYSNKEEVKLILIDLMMPNIDGFVATKTLQAINPNLKILAVTGLSNAQIEKEIQELNIPLLLKPYTAEQLLQKVHDIVTINKSIF